MLSIPFHYKLDPLRLQLDSVTGFLLVGNFLGQVTLCTKESVLRHSSFTVSGACDDRNRPSEKCHHRSRFSQFSSNRSQTPTESMRSAHLSRDGFTTLADFMLRFLLRGMNAMMRFSSAAFRRGVCMSSGAVRGSLRSLLCVRHCTSERAVASFYFAFARGNLSDRERAGMIVNDVECVQTT